MLIQITTVDNMLIWISKLYLKNSSKGTVSWLSSYGAFLCKSSNLFHPTAHMKAEGDNQLHQDLCIPTLIMHTCTQN